MITFVTLFLGLFLGTQPVELRVDEGVAAVELVLDGESLGRLEGPPWSGQLDLGQELTPHHLEGIAFDEDGRELSRAKRWINLPRPPAEVSLFLETAEDGIRTVRIFWESVLGTQPEALRMELDGQPLPEADLSGAVLPSLDEGTIHFVRAEVDFPDNVSTSAELVFGGGFQDAVDTDLTAVPIETGGALSARALQGRLVRAGRASVGSSEHSSTRAGEPLSVVAVEEGGIDLVFVPDAGAISRLRNLALEWESHSSVRTTYRTSQVVSQNEEIRRTLPLPKKQRVRFLWPFPQIRRGEGGIPFNLFVSTPELTNEDGGLVWLMSRTQPPGGLSRDTHLGTAVAVAGSVAAARNRRRAVVVLWTGGSGDRSPLPPETVRRYLADLRVPLHVWTLEEDAGASPWGEEPEEAFNLVKLDRSFRRLNRTLEDQRIAWVSGTHLPQRIRLAAESGLRLAQTPVPGGAEVSGPPPSFQPDRQRATAASPKVSKTAKRETQALEAIPDLTRPPVRGSSLYELGRPRREIRVEEGVRVRAVPDATAPHLAVVDAPAELPEVERRGDWARVTYRGRSGWVRVAQDGTARPEQVAPLPPPELTVDELGSGERTAHQRGERRARAEAFLGPTVGTLGRYDLLTDVDDGDLVGALERLTTSITEGFESRYGLAPTPPEPGEAILLFRHEEDYRRYEAGEGELAGLGLAAHAGGGLAALFVGERDWEQIAALLTHELTHLITDRTLASDLPPWLEEGLADDLALSRIDRQGRLTPGTVGGSTALREERRSLGRGRVRVEQEREISGAKASLLRLVDLVENGGLPSLRDLTALSQEELLRSELRDVLYPMSAFFVRFLLDRERTSEAFRVFLAGVTSAADANGERLVAHLETDWERLQRSFESWLRSEARRLGPG